MGDTKHSEALKLYITEIDSKLGLPGPTGFVVTTGLKLNPPLSKSPLLYFPEKRFLPPELPKHVRDLIVQEQIFIIVPHHVNAVYDDNLRRSASVVDAELSILRMAVVGVWQKIQLLQEYRVRERFGNFPVDSRSLLLSPQEIFSVGSDTLAFDGVEELDSFYREVLALTVALTGGTEVFRKDPVVNFRAFRMTECKAVGAVASTLGDEDLMHGFLNNLKDLAMQKAEQVGPSS